MISLQTYNKNNNSYSDISKENSILIIGKASTERKLNEIYQPNSRNDAFNIYGESELYSSYIDAMNLGATNIYLLNAYKTTDYIDCLKTIKYYNFSYIAPIGINISDRFYSSKYNKEMYYAEFYLQEFSENTNSLIIFTDNHAEFYENIDEYLLDNNNKVNKFKEKVNYLLEL